MTEIWNFWHGCIYFGPINKLACAQLMASVYGDTIGWLAVVICELVLVLVIIILEVRAILDKEVEHITFSRLMWRMFERWPWTRYLVGAIFLGLAIFNAWGFIHIFFGPCAFGWC